MIETDHGEQKYPVIINGEIADECNYAMYEKLTEWHFDIFGLIPKGLAIDINKL